MLLAALPFLLLREFVRQLALAHLRAGEALLVDAAAAAVQLGCLGLLPYFGRLNVPTVYAVMGGTCALICLGWHLVRREPVRFAWRSVAADWRTNWAFGRWALASQLLGRGWSYLMPWVVALVHGEAATASLAVAVTLVNLAGTLVTGVSNFVTPRAAHAFNHGGLPALRRVLRQTAALYLAIVGGFCLVVFVAGEPLATLVYSGRYADVGPILSVLAFAMLANSLSITAGNGLWALDRPRQLPRRWLLAARHRRRAAGPDRPDGRDGRGTGDAGRLGYGGRRPLRNPVGGHVRPAPPSRKPPRSRP